jgi:glutamate-1-semialdehyde 2,1-aminomutase
MNDAYSNSPICALYRERTPGSARLAREAREVMPGGITHDSRYMRPHGVFVERARGSRKWDVDGNEYVDYFGGHGALLLGHGRPEVVEAAGAALALGTQFGASHALEVRWARLVRDLVPSAERVRFTASGTEATHLALRLARAWSGRRLLVRLRSHFHGWHDHVASGGGPAGSVPAGVLPEIAAGTLLLPPGDVGALRDAFAAHGRDIAAVIVEPTGASFGRVPLRPDFLRALREETSRAGAALIFDEVITGFRVAPGGAQSVYGITPDLTTLAKVLAGGLPGGAVAGRADILERLDADAAESAGFEKIQHYGTFNANPVSAAAGIAALEIIRAEPACERANAFAAELRARLNAELAAAGVPWAVYGAFSGFQIFLNPNRRALDPRAFDPHAVAPDELKTNPPALVDKLRMALLANGVDIGGWPGGLTSAAHADDDLDHTVAAFRRAVGMLKAEAEA